ncbi:MAG: MerR family transcriptional regulator, partial [Candidatus Hydrogenedentes bacterium]|nr:MerR family transcriptional regulator [Candidatus Hydrogenedentota bacterium]
MQHQSQHPIQVVALRTGLTPHVIRMWERRYAAVCPTRTPTNRRLYSDSDITRLRLLSRAT